MTSSTSTTVYTNRSIKGTEPDKMRGREREEIHYFR